MCAPSRRIFKEKYLRDRARAGVIPESLPKAVSLIILSHFDDMMEEKKKGKLIEVWKKKIGKAYPSSVGSGCISILKRGESKPQKQVASFLPPPFGERDHL